MIALEPSMKLLMVKISTEMARLRVVVFGLYRFEEINFSHTYTDVIKLEWDEDNERYMVVSALVNFLHLHMIYNR